MISFPPSWKFSEAKALCSELVDCINKTAPTVEFETPYKMIRTTNVKSGRVDLSDAKCVDEATFVKWNRRLTPKYRDIVLTREAPLGDVGLIRTNDKVFLGQRTMLFRANPEVLDQHFLYYTLLGPTAQAQIKTFGSGSTVEHVRVPDAEKITIPYPKLHTQRKIAAILTAYDDLIEVNRRRIALLENMADEIYREWFVRMRFPGYREARFVKGVPEGWGFTRLGEIAHLTMGQSPKSEFYNDIGDGLPFHQGVGSYGERFPITVTYCSVEGRKAFKGDILFSVRAPVGRINIADQELVIGRGLAAIRHVKGNNSYLYYLLKSMFSNEDMIGNGSIFNSVGKDELLRFDIHNHPQALIDQFQNIAKPIDQQIEYLTLAIHQLNETRNLLLPRLIAGKLSIEELDIEFPPSMQEDLSAPTDDELEVGANHA